MRHGQKQKVECVKLAAARRQALFQGCDRLGKLADTVQGDAQGVEAHRFPRREHTDNAAILAATAGSRSGSGPVASPRAKSFKRPSRPKLADRLWIDPECPLEFIERRGVPFESKKEHSPAGVASGRRTDAWRTHR